MTLRKYKKLLMSCGLDRNLAEKERKQMAIMRSNYNLIRVNEIMAGYENLASRYVSACGGGLRQWKRKIKEQLKYIEEHCTV